MKINKEILYQLSMMTNQIQQTVPLIRKLSINGTNIILECSDPERFYKGLEVDQDPSDIIGENEDVKFESFGYHWTVTKKI